MANPVLVGSSVRDDVIDHAGRGYVRRYFSIYVDFISFPRNLNQQRVHMINNFPISNNVNT